MMAFSRREYGLFAASGDDCTPEAVLSASEIEKNAIAYCVHLEPPHRSSIGPSRTMHRGNVPMCAPGSDAALSEKRGSTTGK